jgi:hypothetical protein
MDNFAQALTILSAMITPAVLVLASGSLIMTTSQRLGRVIERTRKVGDRFKELAKSELDAEKLRDERAVLFTQLRMATRRAKLLQRAMVCLYSAVCVFVTTSVAIGLVDLTDFSLPWIPLVLGFAGAGALLYASILLIMESRVALQAVDYEMDFVLHINKQYVPVELTTRTSRPPKRRDPKPGGNRIENLW